MIAPWSLSIFVKNEGLPYVAYINISGNGKKKKTVVLILVHWKLKHYDIEN